MPEPKGRLVTPVGFDKAGKLGALLIDSAGNLGIDLIEGVWQKSGAEQIAESEAAKGEEVTLYTTPSGKVAYITSIYFRIMSTATGATSAAIIVYDPSGTEYVRWPCATPGEIWAVASIPLVVPFRLPAGYYITVQTSSTDTNLHATILGVELPA